MRKMLLSACALVGFALPASADDGLKKMLDELATNYMACYSKQDPACIAALYTSDGFMVNPQGVMKPMDVYTNAFKMGFTKLDAVVLQVHPLGTDSAVATGTYHITGKDKDGKALDAKGNWSAAYIKEGGKLKAKMLAASPKPPPTN